MELEMTFPIILGMSFYPNWRTPSFFRGVGLNHQLVKIYDDQRKFRVNLVNFS